MTTSTDRRRASSILVQGYVIQSRKVGEPWYSSMDSATVYAQKGQLPAEWEGVKSNPEIAEARIYRTTQAIKRADKRILNDSFKREA